MKKIGLAALVSVALSACITVENPSSSAPSFGRAPYALSQNHYADVAKIRAEAQRLGTQVSSGKMTKVQAAQHLNRFRIKTVGRNSVDDSMYEVYQQAAVDSQRGAISAEQSKAYVENALRGWQQRWPGMRNKPTNPAFTNFLLEYMRMQPLQ